jgi:copper chaperone NosL
LITHPAATTERTNNYLEQHMTLKHVLICTFVLSFAVGPALAAEPAAPGKKDRCPVCGMFVAPYSDWMTTIVFQDGSQLFFDGCKDLFRYYFDLPLEDGRQSRKRIATIHITEYYSTRLMKADEVFFVLGSDIYGPMGKELVPVAGKETAMTFLRDHQGTEILSFDQVKPSHLPDNR